ncbi:MAG: hypothetical protein KDB14_21955 [Planctomycetales bacterium]|nr:hypothetical protein [Planctomycetales bacterium]
MSRAFRISVSDSLSKVIRAEDHVCSQLELLEILPPDQMSDLLAAELIKLGFEPEDDLLVRETDGIQVAINVKEGTVQVQATAAQDISLSGEKEGRAYDDMGPNAKKVEQNLREQLRSRLEAQANQQEDQLQRELTDRLEKELTDLRQELDRAVNRATAEALKQKAAQLGQIKEMTEDAETGSLTIVVEV